MLPYLAKRRAPRAATVASLARLVSTKQRRAALASPTSAVFPQMHASTKTIEPKAYLEHASPKDLMCFVLLNFITASPTLTLLGTKALPHTPDAIIKHFVYPVYCGGETYEECVEKASGLLDRGISNMMLSYTVEDPNGTASQEMLDSSIDNVLGSIDHAILVHNNKVAELYEAGETPVAPSSGYVALKPTGLAPKAAQILANFDNPEYKQQWESYLEACRRICRYARDKGQGKAVIVFDAEKTWLQKGVYAAQREMMKEFNKDGNVIVMGTIQMYLCEALDVLREDIELAKKHNYQVAMKLVRGAYIGSEPNRDEVIHATKEGTDASYNAGANLMMDYIVKGWKDPSVPQPVGRLLVASHNIPSCEIIEQRMRTEAPLSLDLCRDETVVFGQLLGMMEDHSAAMAARGCKVIKYFPWGPVAETKEYLARRLEENGDAARGGWQPFFDSIREVGRRMSLVRN